MIKKLRNPDKRDARRQFGVSAYVGANGGGKSACMVWDAIPSLEAGRAVLSTARILDYENPRPCDDDQCAESGLLDHFMMRPSPEGREAAIRNARARFFYGDDAVLEPVELTSLGIHKAAHPLWIPWTSWQQLLDMQFGEVLADEMTGIAEARSAVTLPSVVLNHFQQLRRFDIPFRYTMPAWEQADVSLRRPTQAVTVCRGRFTTEAPRLGDETRVWRSKRLFRWKTYDAMSLTELSEGKLSELTPEVKDWHWGPGSPAWAAYDSFAPVLTVGHVTETGRCHICNGTRPAPKCPGHTSDGSAPRVRHAGPEAPAARQREEARVPVPGPQTGRRVLQVLGTD